MKEFFSNWNYAKHTKLCVCLYVTCFAIDMTFGYFAAKKLLNKPEGE